jgi:hypothetical protein
LKVRASRAAEEVAAEMSSRLRDAMEAAGVPEETIEEQLRRQRADPTYVIPGFTLTASGEYAPIVVASNAASTTATNGGQIPENAYPPTIGPDGMPLHHHDMMSQGGASGGVVGLTGMYSMYPHPAIDAAPINMEAHYAARAAAGYVHPDDRLAMEKKRLMKEVEEEDIRAIKEEDEDAAAAEEEEEEAAAADAAPPQDQAEGAEELAV